MSSKKWKIDDFEMGRLVGKGQFGDVYIVQEKSSKFVLALKMVKKSFVKENELHNQLKREIEIQSHLIHPNILRLYGYFHDASRVYLMVELAVKGELYKDMKRYGRFNDQRTATYMNQLIDALKYCHDRNVMHRDIKPENILMAARGQIKLADFGWSVHNKNGFRKTLCGTLDYLAPEIVEQKNYTEKIDIWCSGVLMYEMLTNTVPFQNESHELTMELIKLGRFEIPKYVNRSAADMIEKVLIVQPTERLTLDEMLQHDYVKQYSENTNNECKAALDVWENSPEVEDDFLDDDHGSASK